MNGDYVVPPSLRSARFVPRQAPGRREPARVTSGAFRAAGLDVPEDPRQLNAYQLSRRQGFAWSPSIDQHVRRRGAELLGGSQFVCVDLDTALAVDGSIWMDGFRQAADLAAETGNLLDLAGCIAVRTPGNGTHGEGWHLWYRANAACPVRFGPLGRCPLIEIKYRCTAPGSPLYQVRSVPDGELDMLPAWIAELAPPPGRYLPPGAGQARLPSGGAWRGWWTSCATSGKVIIAITGFTGAHAAAPR